MRNLGLQHFLDRQKTVGGNNYIQIIAFDDKKKDKRVLEKYFDIEKDDIHDIQGCIETFNTSGFGVFMQFNPLHTAIRNNENIKKYLFAYIDLDYAEEDHKTILLSFLDKNKFKYSYVAESGGGYHIMIPIDLLSSEQNIIKKFLQYLKNNVCDKVDISVNDPCRIFRVPESLHNKKEEFRLKTLFLEEKTDVEIKKNTEKLLEFQEQPKINIKQENNKYTKSISRKDIFFSTILDKSESWLAIFEMLKQHDDKNDGVGNNQIFNKNLTLFVSKNPEFLDKAVEFMNAWKNPFVTLARFKLFLKKIAENGLNKEDAEESGLNVNYFELKKWATEFDLKIFVTLLTTQLQSSFLDDFEIYYLADEKAEFQYLVYYVEKDYFIQKNQNGLVDLIYYEAKEKGKDLIEEWAISKTDERGNPISYKGLMERTRNTIITKLDKHNRIKMVHNINYKPCDDKFIEIDKKIYFNIYKKTAYWDIFNKKDTYSFPNIKELIMNICENKEENYMWFLKWLAFQIQNPTKKLPTAVILQGKQGTGKGVFKTHILDYIFGDNVQEINQTHLESSFNEYLMGKQIIVANEVIHNENKALLPNVLKNLVTDPEITISRKFRKEITGKNYTHWIFCTNNENPLKIDVDDRRYTVFFSKRLKGGEQAACKFVHKLQKNLSNELKDFVSYLKTLKLVESEVRTPILTQAKKEIIELNKDSVHKFIEHLQTYKSYFAAHIALLGSDANSKITNVGGGEEYILTDTLYLVYLEWVKNFGERGQFNKQNFSKKMSSFGISTQVKKIDSKSTRVYDINKINLVIDSVQDEEE